MDGRTDRQTDGWTDERTDGRTDGLKEGRTDIPSDRTASSPLKMELTVTAVRIVDLFGKFPTLNSLRQRRIAGRNISFLFYRRQNSFWES